MSDKNECPNFNKSTPPPSNRKVRNPFDKALIDKLHKPLCSPGMCKIYKKKNTGTFRWDIDQACKLVPTDIVVCNSQFEPSPDPVLEKIAEEATEKFFSQEMVMPSPMESSKKVKPLLQTSCETQKATIVTKDVSAQTMLTLPPELPPELEKLLQPFCTFTQDQNLSGEYEITANGSLRRKLFFEEHSDMEHYDSEQTDDEVHVEPRPPSSYETHTPIMFSSADLLLFEEHSDMEHYDSEPTDDEVHVEPRPPSSYETHTPIMFSSADLLLFEEHSDMEHYDSEPTDDEVHVEPRPPSSYETHTPIMFSSADLLLFEEHSDMEHYDSEPTDDEVHVEPRPPSSYETHTPIMFSSADLKSEMVGTGMKRTFGTPLRKDPSNNSKQCYRNKILDVVDFGEPCFSPIEFRTPKRTDQESATSSSLASASISPVTKATSSDEEKNNFTSPESEAMASCLSCVAAGDSQKKGPCLCHFTPNKIILKRSASLKESPVRIRKGSMSEKRSLSMSSLHRSRSVQKLDFSMNMSVDGSFNHSQADSESSPTQEKEASWSMVEEPSITQFVEIESSKSHYSVVQSSTQLPNINIDDTPIKGKDRISVKRHEISKIRVALPLSPLEMSLDNSLENCDSSLNLEDKKIDFNTVDLKFLTENVSQFNYTTNVIKVGENESTSFKKIDSGFNENTFYANASSYYESAIKPSELTVTNISKPNNKNALKEISNVQWMRVDSGFKDETSTDSMQFYNNATENQSKKFASFQFSEAKVDDKENTEDFDRFLVQSSNKNETMSDIFIDDMTFNCNFSSTPSKNKSRKVNNS